MLSDLYRHSPDPVDQAAVFRWHTWLVQGRTDLKAVGGYRTDDEPMQVVSGPLHAPKVHFEAPPSARVPEEMDAFLTWFNRHRALGPGIRYRHWFARDWRTSTSSASIRSRMATAV